MNQIQRKFSWFLVVGIALAMAACSSTQYPGGYVHRDLGVDAGAKLFKSAGGDVFVVLDQNQSRALQSAIKLGLVKLRTDAIQSLATDGFAYLKAREANDLQAVLGQQSLQGQQAELANQLSLAELEAASAASP